MCGIAAVVNFKGSGDSLRAQMIAMLKAISHRGPDASDYHLHEGVCLGHNRLSIIDLSSSGNQPMHFKTLTMVFNGEVYNYLEIRADLEKLGHVFQSQSDSEVILHAYAQWGAQCADRFMGMWALVIWDHRTREAFISRDRFGIKPLYYMLHSETLYVASEIKALKKVPGFDADLNMGQVMRGLQMGWTGYESETYYNRVAALPAACHATFSGGKLRVVPFWKLQQNEQVSVHYAERCERFRALFLDSVKLHMRSDVEVGSCLSGGLDSSAIVSAIAHERLHKQVKTFSIFYTGSGAVDERPWISHVLAAYPAVKPFMHEPGDEALEEAFAATQFHLDAPLPGSSPVSQYFVMKIAAAEGVRVVLDGQGSDEYLGGYRHSFYRLIGGYFARMKPLRALHEWRSYGAYSGSGASAQRNMLMKSVLAAFSNESSLYRTAYHHYHPLLADNRRVPFGWEEESATRLNAFLYQLLFRTSLPTLLQFEDRNSMAWSIESRVPFLDHRLVEFAYNCPDEDKIKDGVTKRILRDGLAGILPDEIRNRRDKKGFVTPGETRWLRGSLRGIVAADQAVQLQGLRPKRVNALLEAFRKGDNRHAVLVWRISALNEWLKQHTA